MKKLLLSGLFLAASVSADPPRNVALPEWMAGTWAMEEGANWADEVWTDPRGGVMVGVGRAGFGPQLREWEIIQIRKKPDGSMSYIAQPQGKAPTEFPMVLASDEAIEFANPSHDYPQRIRYWRQGKLLMAEISRIDGSDAMRWNYRPVVTAPDEAD